MIGTEKRRRKRLLLGAIALLFVAALLVGWRVLGLSDLMRIGAGYTAQQTCSCLLVSGRTLESCLTDLDPLARRLVRVEAGQGEVTARALGLISATARYEKGFGCSLRD